MTGPDEEKDSAGRPEQPPHLPVPWETDDYATAAEGGDRQRHDAFTPARKKLYLEALSKSGCILDACRETRVSSRTVYYHQGRDPEFRRHCELAIDMAGTTVELMAWERGVTGVEVDVIRGGKFVGTTLKRSDSILRLLLQGSNRKKYGPRPGFSRKRLLKHERSQMEREIRAQMAEHLPSAETVRERIVRKVEAIKKHKWRDRLAAGWTRTEDGYWIPPGWVKSDRADGGPSGGTGETGDSM